MGLGFFRVDRFLVILKLLIWTCVEEGIEVEFLLASQFRFLQVKSLLTAHVKAETPLTDVRLRKMPR